MIRWTVPLKTREALRGNEFRVRRWHEIKNLALAKLSLMLSQPPKEKHQGSSLTYESEGQGWEQGQKYEFGELPLEPLPALLIYNSVKSETNKLGRSH